MIIDLSKMRSGFCDRLRQITFCIALEKLKGTKIKKIFIYEIKNKECPYYFSELLKVKNYNVTNIKKKISNKNLIRMTPFNSKLSLETCKRFNSNNKINNKKLLIEWKKTYQILEPQNKIKKKIDKLIKNKNYYCIHTRVTDKLVSYLDYLLELPDKDVIYNNQLNSFCSNIIKFFPSNKNIDIYISSDENIYRERIVNNIKDKLNVINPYTKFNKSKLRQTNGDDFIVDLFMMSKSSKIISSTGGNVPLTALLISKKKICYIKWTSIGNINKLNKIIRYFIFYLRKFIKV